MRISAIIPSAGRGKRLRENKDKVFVTLDNKPIIYYTLKSLEEIEEIGEIILVVSGRSFMYAKDEFLKKIRFTKVKKVVKGGPTRTDSVWNGLKEIDKTADLILVHDGARPFINKILLKKVIEAGARFGAAVLGVPINATIKKVKSGSVVETVSREYIWETQTPQVFRKDLIVSCYQQAINEGFKPTDDAQVLEHYGKKVKIVEGSILNIKITTPEDLFLAKAILKYQVAKKTFKSIR
ncbi:MAG: 2-C-methyl-D-erythritol 4-phosphate cytidylyltransferase [Candidatus Omnitrophica bacterium]|nr:2-C-methyl-D-erythritol 4-phosphate cytidylyltransferase [Candidatus Omnitrophota bacterium]